MRPTEVFTRAVIFSATDSDLMHCASEQAAAELTPVISDTKPSVS